jgi:glyceraldehyde-3-phosphate dehydrogenase (NADP+)
MNIFNRQHLPSGSIQYLTGSGRKLLPLLMQSGAVDLLAFIGSSAVADSLIDAHPQPHRLTSFLQLEGKNIGIIAKDFFDDTRNNNDKSNTNTLNSDEMLVEVLRGMLSYNGQRCTALKLLLVDEEVIDEFVDKIHKKLSEVANPTLPWTTSTTTTTRLPITAVPGGKKRALYYSKLINDAVSKGSKIINSDGGEIHKNYLTPTLLYPVYNNMQIYNEEQFLPVLPIATYKDISDIYNYYKSTFYGQQVSIFTSDTTLLSNYINILALSVGRININSQSARSPDVLPFTG